MFYNLKVNLERNALTADGAHWAVSTDVILREGYVGSLKYNPYFNNAKYVWIDISRKVIK